MKKELLDITSLFSFFISIPGETNNIESVRCKPSASWSASPLANFFRAFIVTKRPALISSEPGNIACYFVLQKLNYEHVAFCNSLHKTNNAHKIK
jgi:hypothetical protein